MIRVFMPKKCPKAEPCEGPTSADEPALAQALRDSTQQYGSEDVTQQAVMECLEAHGPVFPLTTLAEQAKRVNERYRMRGRRDKKRLVSVDNPDGWAKLKHGSRLNRVQPELAVRCDSDAGTLREAGERTVRGLEVIDLTRDPEASAVARDELQRVEASLGGALEIKRALNGRLSSTERSKLTRNRQRNRGAVSE